MLPHGVELSCSNITSPPKCRICFPRTRVSTSDGMKVFSMKTALVPGLRTLLLGAPVPLKFTVGNTSALENCNPNWAGKPLCRVCGTNQFPCRTNEYRNSFTIVELMVYTSVIWALYPSPALFSQAIGQLGPGSILVLCGLSCIVVVILIRFLALTL